METLVERIQNGILAISNDGSLEELRKVLKHCFPKQNIKARGAYSYYRADHNDINDWIAVCSTYIQTVSVKEVLAEIEGDVAKPKTRVIYLNEDDRPKFKKPLSFLEWFRLTNPASISSYNDEAISIYMDEWLEYRNSFTPNDKPIEFIKYYDQNSGKSSLTLYTPNNFDIVVYAGNGFFWCTDKDGLGTVSVFKGNLNSGKVK